MRRRIACCMVGVALALAGQRAAAQEPPVAPDQLKSGSTFASAEVRALQDDDFANPATLWVERGAKLWSQRTGRSGRSCQDCHGEAGTSMKGVAARYPRMDSQGGNLLDLEGRILQCRTVRQGAGAFKHESEDLLSLATFVAQQSRGVPIRISIEGKAREHFESGREFFYARRGQFNLSCANCHDSNWGRRLFAETISQGHPNAYPGYRLEWQTVGSIERRLRACLSGVRAQMLPYGSSKLLDLELFLAWRAQGLPMEAPGVRR